MAPVTAIRAVNEQHFSFDWAPTLNSGGIDPALAYPGDNYVTDIGMSVYDWSSTPYLASSDRWKELVNNRYGLAWQARFATQHRKPISFPE